jgi:PIN domain nuclease of toxin-antitoxin system
MIAASALAGPFDRWLVATSRDLGVPLVTRDRRILEYARRTEFVELLDAAL